MEIMNSKIIGTGSYIPKNIIKNDAFINHFFLDVNGNKITSKNEEIIGKFEAITGIRERKYALNSQDSSDIAAEAAKNALHSSSIDPETIDYIILAHNIGDVSKGSNQVDAMPSLASRVKSKLGIKNPNCVAYDILFGCPGWLEGLIQSNSFIKAGTARRCLVIGSETLSRVVDSNDRDGMIFSDGAGAVVTELNDNSNDGILSHIAVQAGETVNVDELIAIISEGEIDVTKALENYSKEPIEPSTETKSDVETNEEETSSVEVDVIPEVSISDKRIFASPLAKKIANEKNIDLSQITGSGENGRIVKEDLENISVSEKVPPVPVSEPASVSQPDVNLAPVKPVFNDGEEFTEIENSSMRKAIAKNLSKSKFSAPHYYLSVEFNMDNAIAFREQYNSMPNTKISFNDIIIKACAIALKAHPQVNSQWFDDKIRLNNIVNIGVAVGIEDGLVVPVIKNADLESLHNINSTVRDYAVRAKSKKLRPDEIEGSTFTISNLGMFGIQEFTSIINQPNSAILSVGTIVKKPIVVNEKIVVGNTMKLTLACDHRSVDGVTGSLFLQTLKGYIENPVTILV